MAGHGGAAVDVAVLTGAIRSECGKYHIKTNFKRTSNGVGKFCHIHRAADSGKVCERKLCDKLRSDSEAPAGQSGCQLFKNKRCWLPLWFGAELAEQTLTADLYFLLMISVMVMIRRIPTADRSPIARLSEGLNTQSDRE